MAENDVEVMKPQGSIKIDVDKNDLMAVTVYEQECKLEAAKNALDFQLKTVQKDLNKTEADITKAVEAAGKAKFDADFQESIKSVKAFGFEVSGELSSQLWELKDLSDTDKSKIQVTLTLKTGRQSYNDSISTVKDMDVPMDIKAMITSRNVLTTKISDLQTKMMKVRKTQDNMGKLERGARARLAVMNLEQTSEGRKALEQLKASDGMPGAYLLGDGANA